MVKNSHTCSLQEITPVGSLVGAHVGMFGLSALKTDLNKFMILNNPASGFCNRNGEWANTL